MKEMTIEKLLTAFEMIEDWEERYRIIIDLSKQLPEMPEEYKTEENKVRGCMSQVWMVTRKTDSNPPKYEFLADSDSIIVKGLIGILLMLYSGKSAPEIDAVDIQGTFSRLGLEQHLSPNRRNGFFSMVEKIKTLSHNGQTVQ